MGIFETIGDVIQDIGKAGQIALFIFGILLIIFFAVIPIASMTWDNREEIVRESEGIGETIKNVAPEVFEGAKVYCELDETILSQLSPNTIGSYMLNNVKPRERMILENWRDTGEITACEINILNKNIDENYKKNLNLKSVIKSIVGCNLVDCLDKYKVLENIDS